MVQKLQADAQIGSGATNFDQTLDAGNAAIGGHPAGRALEKVKVTEDTPTRPTAMGTGQNRVRPQTS